METIHSVLFERLKRLYDNKEITKEKLIYFKDKGALTLDEYNEIVSR